jgi:hypothetical protein
MSVVVATETGSRVSVAATVGVKSGIVWVGFDCWGADSLVAGFEGIEVDRWGTEGIKVGWGESSEQATNNSVANINNPLWTDDFIVFPGIYYRWADKCDEKPLVVSDN